jgi:hypothetical protein
MWPCLGSLFLDITQAIEMPLMPGQSRSLLHFTPVSTTKIKRKFSADNNAIIAIYNVLKHKTESRNSGKSTISSSNVAAAVRGKLSAQQVKFDHDYFGYLFNVKPNVAKRAKVSVLSTPLPFVIKEEKMEIMVMEESNIEKDAQGYGPGKADAITDEWRVVNVTAPGMLTTRTVVLHLPKDIKLSSYFYKRLTLDNRTNSKCEEQ